MFVDRSLCFNSRIWAPLYVWLIYYRRIDRIISSVWECTWHFHNIFIACVWTLVDARWIGAKCAYLYRNKRAFNNVTHYNKCMVSNLLWYYQLSPSYSYTNNILTRENNIFEVIRPGSYEDAISLLSRIVYQLIWLHLHLRSHVITSRSYSKTSTQANSISPPTPLSSSHQIHLPLLHHSHPFSSR